MAISLGIYPIFRQTNIHGAVNPPALRVSMKVWYNDWNDTMAKTPIPAAAVWEWLNSLKIPLGRTYNGGDQWGSSCYWVVCIARYNHQPGSVNSMNSVYIPAALLVKVSYKTGVLDQYLLIPFLGGWTSIYQLFWCELQGYKVLTHCHMLTVTSAIFTRSPPATCTSWRHWKALHLHWDSASDEKGPERPAVFTMNSCDYYSHL